MDSRRFDNLARSLGRSASRRGAFGILVGGLALLQEAAPGLAKRRHGKGAQRQQQASATKGGGNSACAVWCHQVFGDTAAAGQCTAQAAHRRGPCYACGPAAPKDAGQHLCGTTCIPATHCCVSTRDVSPGDPCDGSTTCCSGTCTNLATDPNHCGACTTACVAFSDCCNGSCIFTDIDPSNCGTCGTDCSAVGVDFCEDGTCCQFQIGESASCSATLPCCGSAMCRSGGPHAGTCCAPSGTVTCSTTDPSFCCNSCVPFDSTCTGNCPGQCS